ncbi:hypothetical protein ACLKA6_016198 [Drosophila palustris]
MEDRDPVPFQKSSRLARTPPSNKEDDAMQMALSPERVTREPNNLHEVHEQMSGVIYTITTLASGQRHINQFLRDQLAKLTELNETALIFSRKESFCKETQTVINSSQAVTAETQTTPQAMPHANRGHRVNSPRNGTPKRPRDITAEQRLTPPKKSKSRQTDKELQKQGSQRAQQSTSKLARPEDTAKDQQKKPEQQKSTRRPRSDAIRVSGVGGCTFADLLRSVKGDSTLKHISGDVQGIRKAANGDLLLRLTKQPAHSTDELQETVRKALGEKAVVKALTDQTRVEIRDLDELTTKEEIIAALNNSMEVTSFDTDFIKSLRATKDGLHHMSFCLLPAAFPPDSRLIPRGVLATTRIMCHHANMSHVPCPNVRRNPYTIQKTSYTAGGQQRFPHVKHSLLMAAQYSA